jgi:TonB family protein
MADETRTYGELIDAARLASNRGDRAEAERLLAEALAMGERQYGAEHPSLGAALNELGRLYVRQAQHARAEEVLERLLRITRKRGDEHPDVATALAGLALVNRALGDEALAEERLREALRIRERALAPQHMATVVTMEQLSEVCAARGNVTEALALLQRALPTRDAALGADHATVRSLRARIAELELRALASSFASSEPALEPWEDAEERVMAAVGAPSDSRELEASLVANHAARATTSSTLGEPTRRPSKRRFLFPAFACVAAVALATAGMTARSRANAEDVRVAAGGGASSAANGARATETAPSTTAASVARLATAESASATGIVQAGAPMTDSAVPVAAPKLPRVPKNLAALTAQLIATNNADSLVRASTKLDRELASDRIGSGIVTSSHLEDTGAKPAALLEAPPPHFPDELRSHWRESEVVVRFRVDERGRVDVGSMKVVKSDHDRFVAAVREALPRFRFEPARSAAPESKPVADWVDFRIKFTATK